jgi:hypothetical protein
MNLDVSRNNTRDRVFYGKQVEQSILNTLKHLGYDITPASLYEDTQEKYYWQLTEQFMEGCLDAYNNNEKLYFS